MVACVLTTDWPSEWACVEDSMGTKYNKSYISSISYSVNRKVSVSGIVLCVVHQQFIIETASGVSFDQFKHGNDNWTKHTFSATKSLFHDDFDQWDSLIEIEVARRSTRLNWIITAFQLDFYCHMKRKRVRKWAVFFRCFSAATDLCLLIALHV